MTTIEQMERIWGPKETWLSIKDAKVKYEYALEGGPHESMFINMDNLTEDERDIIVSLSDKWVYGKQVVLQSEFVKKDQSK